MMTKQDQEDFTKAFNAPTEDAAEGPDVEADSVTLNEGVPVGDPVAEATPPEVREEQASTDEAPAEVADAPTEEAPESPEEAQRRKSWEGRLKKMEAELKAREAALAARETPATLADGGKVEDEEVPKDVTITIAEGGGDGAVTVPDAEAYADGGEVSDSIDAIKAEALDLAGNPEKLASVLKTMIADYGRDFVVGAVALAAPLIDAKAEGYVNDVNGNLESLVSEVQQAFSSMHRSAIADAHEDFEEIVEGEAFQSWLAGLDEAAKAKAEKVVESGSAGAVIKLLGEFKKSLEAPKEPTAADVWAEDAATSVRSSSPLKIPSRAPESEQDEYKRAFDEA